MKTIIQDKCTEKYLFSASSWTDKEDEALDFESEARAKSFCREHQLSDALIIVRHRGHETDVVIPYDGDVENDYARPALTAAI